ncbi:hypothetical protein LshimejAT787_1802230 [Lyophyllum shimeji]|uniref:Uncharacterized protein n=1 Tax=Lyophyllum shimeji TaxID=47721 RepID=A0A9P3Q091_LYOSH|nr:hypothetical protein LshimejAT787_1802230 [Lyophyllum shimeji]
MDAATAHASPGFNHADRVRCWRRPSLIWKPYELYEKVDYVYGVKAFENGEGFAGAAAVLNVIEISTNLITCITRM